MREIGQRELRNDSGKIMREIDSGQSFRAVDLLIAVTSLPARLPLFTRNEADFAAGADLVGIVVV